MSGWHIGVIGGPGLHGAVALEEAQEIAVASSFGQPSGPVAMGLIGGVRFSFLPRGEPSEANHRANIDVLKRCGVTDLLAFSAAGSLRDDLTPGDLVAVDQTIDLTAGGGRSFFAARLAAEVDLADPVCSRLLGLIATAAEGAGANVHRAGCYLAIDPPLTPTRAESALYRQWGADVIGTGAMPEARLAREAELPYALLADVIGADRHPVEDAALGAVLIGLARALPPERAASPIDRALDGAILTPPEQWDRQIAARLDAVAGRILRAGRPDWF